MLLCNAILGGGEQNRLYTVIRGEQSLCYEAGSWYDGHKGIPSAPRPGAILPTCPPWRRPFCSRSAHWPPETFSQQELDTARAGLLSDLRAMYDSPGRF